MYPDSDFGLALYGATRLSGPQTKSSARSARSMTRCSCLRMWNGF